MVLVAYWCIPLDVRRYSYVGMGIVEICISMCSVLIAIGLRHQLAIARCYLKVAVLTTHKHAGLYM